MPGRLDLRPFVCSDAPGLFTFLGDPAAMRFTHCHASLQECRKRLAAFEWGRRQRGYAPWTARTPDGVIVGWGGLYVDPFDPAWGVEIGYQFHPAAWGRGYATALVTDSLVLADSVLRLPLVRAFAHPQNAGSRRVLEKTGFRDARFVPEMNRLLYERRG